MPVSAASSPVIIFNRVDLPAPLIPTMAAFSWSSILKEQDLIIMSVPKDLLILLQDKIIDTPLLYVSSLHQRGYVYLVCHCAGMLRKTFVRIV